VNIIQFFRKIFLANSYFIVLSILYIFVGFFVVIFVRKGDDVIWLNQFHQSFADYFFQYATHLGDGLCCIVLSLIFLFLKKYKDALLIFLVFTLSGLLAQFFKKVVFSDIMRPIAYLGREVNLHLVEGVEVLTHHSFPSGHTATAFATFLMLSFIFTSKIGGFFFFFLALVVSISRVYLIQHFFVDTYVGALLGMMSALLIYYWSISATWFTKLK
jgi:membrane-associated phospholipid phosphatase